MLLRNANAPHRMCVLATAAWAALVLSVQSCGVMSPDECTQKAVCTDTEGGLSGDDVNLGGDSSLGSDRPIAENDSMGQNAADSRDAFRDAGGEVGIVDVTPVDGCAAPSTCVPSVPSGWSGPDLFWSGSFGASPPSCPSGYMALDLKAGFTAGGPDTCSCACNLSSELCSVTGTFHSNITCGGQTCPLSDGGAAAIQVSPQPDGGCTPVPSNMCPSTGSFDTPGPIAYQANCTPQVTTTTGSGSTWATSARVCSVLAVSTADCDAGQQCLPGQGSNFAGKCIHQSGDMSCPSAGYTRKTLFYSGEMDTRNCGSCMCAADGGSCSGTVSAYGTTDCTSTAFVYDFSLTCQPYGPITGDTLSPNPRSAKATYMIPTHGTCRVLTMPQPAGSDTPTGATTVCCM
jgi:hypothetical protein